MKFFFFLILIATSVRNVVLCEEVIHYKTVLFAQVGKEKQCVRLQLSVLNWNTPSRDFYAAKGAQDLTVSEGWHFIRFDGQNLDNLANDAPKN